MKRNHVKEALTAGETAIGTMVFEFNTPGVAAILEQTGSDFVIYDMEHSGIGMESMRQLMSYNRGASILPFVRVPDSQYSHLSRILDIGALGLMIPFVETKEQAERIIDATKYGPLGKRGTAFSLAHDDFIGGDISEKMKRSNQETLIIAQIENETGLSNVEEITATEGVDVVFVGNLDLSQSMGISGQYDHPRLLQAMEHVVEVCEKHGKAAGCFVADVEAAIHWKEKGYRFIAYSGDVWLYQQAVKQGIATIRNASS